MLVFKSNSLFLIGWAIQHAGYLFLERIWEKDQQKIKSIINYYKSYRSPISVCNVLFIK
jgi:hypothetical protein